MRALQALSRGLRISLIVGTLLAMAGTGDAAPETDPRGPVSAEDLAAALEMAGANREALQAVLQHYEDRGDSLGLLAARYLIANMPGHSYVRFDLYDSAGRHVDLDILAYTDYETLIARLDALEAQRGELRHERAEVHSDLETVPASLLIENIDQALRARRERPWTAGVPFGLFCEYVLPYRGSNEPLENWRSYFLNRYKNLPREMADPGDPLEAARLINADLMSWFRFDPRFYHHPTDQGLSELLTNRIGRCEDMTNLTIYAMRANGLAVTSDYTPYWADANNNHAWNAILDATGKSVVFMGAEAQPGEYRLANRAAKIYRKTYARQLENLAFLAEEGETVPPWLAGRNYLDVTASYGPVTDVAVDLAPPVPDSLHIAYLCVFNTGEWQPVHWGAIQEGRAVFTAMARGIVYLPGYYLEEEIAPAAPAFILDEEGRSHPLSPRPEETRTMWLAETERTRLAASTDGVLAGALTPGKTYQFYYWDDAWIPAGEAAASDQPLTFPLIPSGALYRLLEEGGRGEERIFTYEDGAQVWW